MPKLTLIKTPMSDFYTLPVSQIWDEKFRLNGKVSLAAEESVLSLKTHLDVLARVSRPQKLRALEREIDFIGVATRYATML